MIMIIAFRFLAQPGEDSTGNLS